MRGYISIHRKISQWEWYLNIPVKVLFIHLLLKANWRQKKWEGITIEKGALVCSLASLSSETGLSIQQVRTALKKLESTQCITQSKHNKYSYISIVSFEQYQDTNTVSNNQSTINQQSINNQSTTTYKENNINNINNSSVDARAREEIETSEQFANFVYQSEKTVACNENRIWIIGLYRDWAKTENFQNMWEAMMLGVKGEPSEVLKDWILKGNWQDVRTGAFTKASGWIMRYSSKANELGVEKMPWT